MSTLFRIVDNRLRLADAVAPHFNVAVDEFGQAIAFSSDTLIVFYDEVGSNSYRITSTTFRYLAGGFFVLSSFLYYFLDRLGEFSVQHLAGVSPHYVWDNQRAYYINGPVQGADPSTFIHLGGCWAKDKRHCYRQELSIADADPEQFRTLAGDYATDGIHVYGGGGTVIAPFSGEPNPLGRGYFLIGAVVFFGDQPVAEADPASFVVMPHLTPESKRAIWASGGPRTADESWAIDGFVAYDRSRLFKGTWSKQRPTS